jgi:DNA-binding MurR/RpiR family transcriptional regulator
VDPSTPLHERIEAATLTPSEGQVAAFMAANPALVAVSSTAELGTVTSTSDATVVRTTKKLGYSSFRDLRRSALAISSVHRDPSRVLDEQIGQISASNLGAKKVLRDTAELLNQLEGDLDLESWNRAVSALAGADRVITFGIGPSGSLADYLSIALNRTGVRSLSIETSGFRLADDLLHIGVGDAFVVFATMRRFREVDVVLDHAARVGATTVLVSETLGEALRDRVDVVLSTPQTTTGTSDGVVIGMVIAHALGLAIAAQNQQGAVDSMKRLNALRADIVGGDLDADG